LDYAEAPCQYNCVECGRVCPTGAIRSLTLEEKRRTRIALSALIFERCVVKTKGQSCGACAEVCPTRAVRMVSYGESGIPGLTRPVFDGPYCIGCGACLVACPAEPRAFVITSVADQTLTPGLREEDDGDGEAGEIYQMTGDFPF
jgi:ferredoxin